MADVDNLTEAQMLAGMPIGVEEGTVLQHMRDVIKSSLRRLITDTDELTIDAVVDGEFLKRVGTEIVSAVPAGGGGTGRPLYPTRAGQWYGTPNSGGGIAVTLDVIRFVMFPYDWVASSFDRVGFIMGNVGTGNAKVGRYSIDANGLPDTLLTDYGTVALDGSLPSGINEFAITESLLNTSAFYFIAYLADTTLTHRATRLDGDDGLRVPLGWNTVGSLSGPAGFEILSGGPSFTTGLPATLSGAQKAALTASNLPPVIQLRAL